MARSRADQLKSMKMPAQRAAEEEAGEDLALLGAEEDEMTSEEEMPEGEEMAAEESPLKDLSDEDLIAEMRARGLLDEERAEEEEEAPAPAKKGPIV